MMKKTRGTMFPITLRRLLPIAAVFLFAAAFLIVPAMATEELTPDGTCGDGVKWVLTENQDPTPAGSTSNAAEPKYYTLTISGTGTMEDNANAQWRNYLTSLGQTSTSTVRGNGGQTFYHITKIVIEEGVTSISDSAFANTMVSDIDLGNVQKIGKGVFTWANWLEDITIPASVTNLNYDEASGEYYNTFDGAFYLKSMTVVEGNANYKIDNGMLIGKISGTNNWIIVNCPDNLDGVTSISKDGFTEPSITAVGRTAFSACRNLEAINLPDTVTEIQAGAFNKCYALKAFTMPESLTVFGGNFQACRSLESINFNNVASITSSTMFTKMTPAEIGETGEVYGSLTSVDLSKVTSIGNSAFMNSVNLNTVTFNIVKGGTLSIGTNAFKNCGLGSTTFDFSVLDDDTSYISQSAFDADVTVIYPIVSADNAVAAIKDASNKYTYYKSFEDALSFATSENTLVLMKDVEISKQIQIGTSSDSTPVLNLDLNGHILRQTAANRVFLVYGTLTLSDTNPSAVHYYTVDNTRGSIWVVDDSNTEGAKIYGGIITGGNCNNNGGAIAVLNTGVLTMTGGNIVGCMTTNSATASGGVAGISVANSAITISGGAVMGNVWYKDNAYGIRDINGGTISGGLFTTEIKSTWCADGKYPWDNGDGTYTVSDTFQNAVAKVGELYFETVNEALNYANSNTGSTVTLLADCTMTACIIVNANTDIVLDLNGHILTAKSGARHFQLTKEGSQLTIRDTNPTSTHTGDFASIKGGIMTGASSGNSGGSIVVNANGAVLNIEGGTWTGNSSSNTSSSSAGAINVVSGSATISGGAFYGNTAKGNIQINGISKVNGISKAVITGGIFGQDVQDGVATDYIQYKDGELYYVVAKSATPTKAEYVFEGWYTNASCTEPAGDSLSNTTLYYAKWGTCTHNLVQVEAKAATCTEAGYDAYEDCEKCDYTTYEEIPATGHTLTRVAAKPATCTEAGYAAYEYCTKCDYTTYEEIPATGHNIVQVDAKAATCTKTGYGAYECCIKCDYTTKVEIPTTDHTLTQVAAKDATCTEAGYEAYEYCTKCDYTTKVEIPATGHSYDDGVVTTAPTSTEPGVKTFTCQNCLHTYTEVIAATGHHAVSLEFNSEQGTVTADYATAASGDLVTLTVSAKDGYELESLTGAAFNELVSAETTTYTFTMPEEAVTITAAFSAIPPATPEKEPAVIQPEIKTEVTTNPTTEEITIKDTSSGETPLTKVDDNTAKIEDANGSVTVTVEFEGTATFDDDANPTTVTGKITTVKAEYAQTKADTSASVPAVGEVKQKVTLTLTNFTTDLPKLDFGFRPSVGEQAKLNEEHFIPLAMLTAEQTGGTTLTSINNNYLKKDGKGITIVFTLERSIVERYGVGNIFVLHLKDGVKLSSPTFTVKDKGTHYEVTVIAGSFSNYVLGVKEEVQQPSNDTPKGSSVWLTESQAPTQTPSETPTTQPTDVAPTDVPTTQPTPTETQSPLSVLAVLGGLGAVAVLRRK